MSTTRKRFGTITALLGTLLLLTAGLPATASAQSADSPWVVEGRGGISVPAGDLADVFDVGPSFGAGIGYAIHPRVTLRVDGDVGILSGADLVTGAEAPDTRLWHYNGGVEFQITPPDASPWSLTANVGAGATTFSGDDFRTPVTNPVTGETVTDFSETYFTANGGLKVGYAVTPAVDLYAGGQWYLTFADEEDTAVFSALSPSEVDAFDTASEIPLVLGVRASF